MSSPLTNTSRGDLDPRIGMLNCGRFYCFPRGYAKPEFVGTLQEVQVALGIKTACAPEAPVMAKPRRETRLHTYEITVTPKVTVYAGSWRGDAYTVQVQARSRSDAISQARRMRNAEEGRHAVAATFRAEAVTGGCKG